MSEATEKAAGGILDLSFTPSLQDHKVLARHDPRRPFLIAVTLFSRLGAFALAGGIAAAGLWAIGSGHALPLEDWATAIMAGIAGLMAFRLAVEKTVRQGLRNVMFGRIKPISISGDGQEISLSDGDITTRLAFSRLDRPVRTGTHLILAKGQAHLLALPRSAFDTPATFDAFATFLEGAAAAQQTAPISETRP